MRAFHCPTCNHLVFFENTACLACGTALGFDPAVGEIVVVDAGRHRPCANAAVAACNWLVDRDDPNDLCRSCRLTRTRPPEGVGADDAFAKAEAAKRRLVFQLFELRLPIRSYVEDRDHGAAFDLLTSAIGPVTTGHLDGVVTVDISESDDVHREWVRLRLGEPYRTMLGHFRHEIGHYYWTMLVERAGGVDEFRERFGDERQDYAAALDRHYSLGPPDEWSNAYVSAYATMHPWEDWAETFAHVLHILDALQTAASFHLDVLDSPAACDPLHEPFERVLEAWLPLSYALNAVNRSMGNDDLYPFVLAPAVVEKMAYVHRLVREASSPQPQTPMSTRTPR